MYQARFISVAALVVLTAGVPAFGQSASLRLTLSETTVYPGQQVTVEAFISNLPNALYGYQIGLDITGGTSGHITAAPFEDSVRADTDRSDWVFRELADADEVIYAAGDNRDPPRIAVLIGSPDVGAHPTGERYLGTFVLEVPSGAYGDFDVAFMAVDSGSPAALMLLGAEDPTFPQDPSPPGTIPATTSSVALSVPVPSCIDADGDGYGSPGNPSCPNGAGFDCDDTNDLVFPGAEELCDDLDNDCNGETDEAGVCGAELRLSLSQATVYSGHQVTVEAFISYLPDALHGYQIGLDITGGTSGHITAAQFEDSVVVDTDRSDWVFREAADADEVIYSAGDKRDPPRIASLIASLDVGALPSGERYLGTFVLEVPSDAYGDFEIGFVPADAGTDAALILLAVGNSGFPSDPGDPGVIPATTSSVTLSVQVSTCIDADGDGYGSPGHASCPNGAGFDCDDTSDLVFPGAEELCDDLDNDCNGDTDEAGACGAELRLALSQATIYSGRQVTVEAFISYLPEALHGYQIGLDITGGASGLITAAQFEDSVVVDTDRSDWVFREAADADELIYSAGDKRDPPRIASLIASLDVGAQPTGERYLGTFVLEASSDAVGDFDIAFAPADAGTGAALILLAVGNSSFPSDPSDPGTIPATISSVTLSVQFPTCIDADSDGYGSPGDPSCPNGSEVDCDDTSDVVFPGAEELCDDLDNDCNGETDEAGACGAELRLALSQSTIYSGQQVTAEAFISYLPEALHGYQIGLDITGGAWGQITAAQFEGSVGVDTDRSDWVFREDADADELIYTAGDKRDPPRIAALIASLDVGAQPTGERYLGAFVLEAPSDAFGDFDIAFAPADAGTGAALMLLAVGYSGFPSDPGDPGIIPATISSVTLNVQVSTCIDADGDGYGSPSDPSCPKGPGFDCDDGDALINPDAAELCDDLDNDCDGETDEDGVCGAVLRLSLSQTTIDSGQQVTVEAFISHLPVSLHGYQIGLDITGGTSGQVTAAQFDGSVGVDHARADWAFREISDAGVEILSAGDKRFPPRLLAIILPLDVGAQPIDERYLGTFVLEASSDATGDFLIGITPPDVADSGAGTILITVGGSVFPASVDDPAVIPISTAAVTMSVQIPVCDDVDSDGLCASEDNCPNHANPDQLSPVGPPALDPLAFDDGFGTNNRYLSIVSGNPGQRTALRLTLSALPAPHNHADGRGLWVGPPIEVSENAGKIDPADAPGFPTYWAAELQCDPYYTDWSAFPVVHVYGESIVPSGMYDVQAIAESCQEASESSYSTPLALTQSRWGDVISDCVNDPCGPPDGVVNVTSDVTAVLNKFKNLLGAPIKARSDLAFNLPDKVVNISDITMALNAFGDFPYPFAGPPTVDPCGP